VLRVLRRSVPHASFHTHARHRPHSICAGLRPSLQAINATLFARYTAEAHPADKPRMPECAALVAGTRICLLRVNRVRLLPALPAALSSLEGEQRRGGACVRARHRPARRACTPSRAGTWCSTGCRRWCPSWARRLVTWCWQTSENGEGSLAAGPWAEGSLQGPAGSSGSGGQLRLPDAAASRRLCPGRTT
jgi:hypothetical protein